jgi:glutamate synthase domain-containing protein 3
MYGATGGRLFAAGRAGERFCVRNSGGLAVVEGCGDHGCEYMTNGVAAVLGPTGRNFGAGMSGGIAFVLDLDERNVNPGMVSIEAVDHEVDRQLLRAIVGRHAKVTRSEHAAELLADWEKNLARFKKVLPHPSMEETTAKEQDADTLEGRYLLQLQLAESPVLQEQPVGEMALA